MKSKYAKLIFLVFIFCSTSPTKSQDAISRALAKMVQQIHNEQQSNNYDDTIINKYSELKITNLDAFQPEPNNPYLGEEPEGFPVVSTPKGNIMGATNSLSHGFYGIPFARPPVRDLRFEAPLPTESFTETFNATSQSGRMCHQITEKCNNEYCDMSEDCLVLNIDVPKSVNLDDPTLSPDDVLPVLFWIHGGFFYQGRGTTPKTDGRWLSDVTNTIVVTINYRLGPFGFMVLEEGGNVVGGNQGLKDQQMALEWVNENIGSFGGDKNQVTLFGNSAGCQSVNFHLISSTSEPLFKHAILQSAPIVFSYQTQHESLQITQRQLQAVNCSDAACLRTIDATTLRDSLPQVIAKSLVDQDFFGTIEPFRPIIDGHEFIDQPINMFQKGAWQNYKHVVIGSTEEEMGWISAIFENIPITKKLFQTVNDVILGPDLGQLVAQKYIESVPNTFEYTDVFAQEVTDLFFTCPNRALARFASESAQHQPHPPVYLYIDSHPLEGASCEATESLPSVCGYSYHSSEIVFVFNSPEGYELTFSEADETVTSMFNTYWGNFARTGDPNSSGGFTHWPNYEAVDRNNSWSNIRIMSPQSEVVSRFREDFCDMWDATGFYVNITSPTTDITTSEVTTTTASEVNTTTASDDTTTTGDVTTTTSDVTTTTSDVTTTTGDVTTTTDNVTTTTGDVTTTTIFEEPESTTDGAVGSKSSLRICLSLILFVFGFNQIF